MDPSLYQQAAFLNSVAAAARLRRGVLTRSLENVFHFTPASFSAVQAP